MFELRSVTKRFGRTAALSDISCTFQTGRTTVLLGTSGCGKSTLLRTLIGLVQPDAGEVLAWDEPVTKASCAALRAKTGYVVQSGGLFPHLTARGNAALAVAAFDWAPARVADRVDELRAMMDLPVSALDRYPAQLSGGQRQRVSLLRAMMRDPDVLLLDEPLGALDPITRHDLQRELGALFERLNKTVVLVTHDLGEAAYLGHRLVLMKGGRIVQQGSAEDLVRRPADAWVERFVRSQRSFALEGADRGAS